MEALTVLTSLPDTTIMVVAGFALTTLALILKRRLISSHVEPSPAQGQNLES
jgi:hypothetical protein